MHKILSKHMIWLFCFAITTTSSFSVKASSTEKTYVLSSAPNKRDFVTGLSAHSDLTSESLTEKGKNLFRVLFADRGKNRGQRDAEIKIKAPYHSEQSASQDLTNFLQQADYIKKNYKLKISLIAGIASDEIRVSDWEFLKIEGEDNSLIQYILSLNLEKNIPIRVGSHINRIGDSENLKDRLISEQQLHEVQEAISGGRSFIKVFIDSGYHQEQDCEMASYLEMPIHKIEYGSVKGFIATKGNVKLIYITENIGSDGINLLKEKGYKVLWDEEAIKHH